MTIECAVMFWQCEEIPSINQMICPCSLFVGFLMHLGFTSHRSEWHFVVIKGSAEMCICQKLGVRLDCQIKSIVILVCGSNRSQRFGGKLSATQAKSLKKWALKLRMAPWLHCVYGILVVPIPCPVCMCHRCDSSCFQIPYC
jgi:hypothetical protein